MGKTVLLGVTGCIAAYKSCEILRQLQKAGYRVKVVMTEHATQFVTPTTFRALSHEPVAVGLFDDAPGDPIHHISLSQEADLFVIAPCTANVIGKIAHGIADDLLTTTAMATTAPLVIAPAMNVHMYEAAATQENLALLQKRGVHIIDADAGYLACGDEGKGRLADPERIVAEIVEMLECEQDYAGKRVLITTGPTEEPIDAVRYLSNPSSGKTGFALAEAARDRGAEVILVTGPVSLDDPADVKVIRVRTAIEMYEAVSNEFPESDVAIFSAAVSDYRPKNAADRKLKKGVDDDALKTLELVENPDILASMGAQKAANQVVVGFAAETSDVEENARQKLEKKNADMIVGNNVSNGRAFGTDANEVMLVTNAGCEQLPPMQKDALADSILDKILAL